MHHVDDGAASGGGGAAGVAEAGRGDGPSLLGDDNDDNDDNGVAMAAALIV